ncbi:hypothetical protein CULT_630027 [[Clostridium] ultunense Esp]|uniref:LysM peptidoglycan-binding domain-containing protein n=1 Tax=Thermicanus aegyptius TaxID=94009 RepID=UPI0002B6FC87|nr:LysM peptidoglycan-binding domain-containing protein [Thermicanus aegyptius]CCQ97443.1 hypothetical protein CULT_630027 [[Clostridium] ultunense Esp]
MEKGNRITFELQERIPLEDNLQDSSQIVNVELLPEIEMVAVQNAYRIRGFLTFSGEYEIGEMSEGITPPYLPEKEVYHRRALRKIYYRIPVDISLPAYRVDENGVILQINSLDYELIASNRLLVTAEVELDGIKSGNEKREEIYPLLDHAGEPLVEKTSHWERGFNQKGEEETVPEKKEEAAVSAEKEEEPSGFEEEDPYEQETYPITEAKPLPKDQNIEVLPASAAHPEDRAEKKPPLKEMPPVEEKVEEEEVKIEIEIEGKIAFEEEPPKVEKVEKEVKKPEKEIPLEKEPKPIPEPSDDFLKGAIAPEKEKAPVAKEKGGLNEDPKVSLPQKMMKEALTPEKIGISLFKKLFPGQEEEKAQMRLCFVQPDESIEEIAERFQMKAEEILRYNGLSSGREIKGVIKIPVRKVR